MATSPNATQITPPRVPIIDERTGAVSREWYRWFYSLYNIVGGGLGIIPVPSGGTGLSTIPTNGQLLIGNGTGYTLNTLGTGAGISVTNGAGTISVANTGVLSNIAGTGISVSNATGNVTIANTGVLSFSGGTTGLTPAAITTGDVTLAGLLGIANGGTNGSSTPTAGAVPYGTGTAYAFTAVGSVGQVLTSNGAGVPTWATNASGDVVGPASSTDNAIARFDGVTGKLIQNSVTTIDDTGNASGILSQQFSNGSAVTLAAGKMWYDGSTGAWNLGMGNGNITQQVGEEIFVYGKASAAITDSPLQIIYHTGVVGASGVIKFAPTVAGITDVNAIIGIATESLALNDFGRATVFGVVRGITTNGTAFGETWADDDVIWYNPVTGNPTKVEPVAPYIKVQVGLVIKAGSGGSGSFQVNIARGSTLGGTDSNVQFGTLANNNLIAYDSTLGYWKNVTSSALGLVTSVTGTSPVVSSGGTTPAISLAAGYGDTLNPYASKTANFVLAAPNGSAGVPTFRALVAADVPGSALTKTDDTNVTLTLGGSPTTALLNAASLTLGWSGQLATGRGGTGLGSYTAGDLSYYASGTAFTKLAIGAANTVLTSSGSAPQWSTGLLITSLTVTNGVTNTNINLTSEANAALAISRYSTNVSGPVINLRKGRGTIAAQTTVASGDLIGDIFGQVYDGANTINATLIRTQVITYTAAANINTAMQFLTRPTGGAAVVERMRINTGVSIGTTTDPGIGNLLVSGTVNTGGYTVATLPAGVIGARAYVTNALAPAFGAVVAGGGAVTIPVFYNGANWIVG